MEDNLDRNTDRFCKAIAQELHALRSARKMSQTLLAQESHLSQAFIGLIERSERIPTVATLFRLATNLGTTPDQILAKAREHMLESRAVADANPAYGATATQTKRPARRKNRGKSKS